MNRQYYFLVSSLDDLYLDSNKLSITIRDFIDFCSEEMALKDYNNLKKLFLFNDVRNAIYLEEENFNYFFPSYYSEDEFKENLKDSDTFFIFLAEYFYYKKTEKRLFPDLCEIDEIVMLLYKHLDEFAEGFIKDYFIFELELQNITSALSLKANSLKISNKIIPFGETAQKIIKSSSLDFGLSSTVDYIEELIEVYKTENLVEIERTIEEIRWRWLEEKFGYDFFGAKAVYIYAVQLMSIERWVNMTDQKGDEVLDNLIRKIENNVMFSEEFTRR